jgi:hypothetical protein
MGYNTTINDEALGNGGAGNPNAWDILTSTHCDLTGKNVAAFMSMDDAGGTFTAMEEETTMARAGKAGVSEAVAANILAYTYPQYIIFEGRYTKLIPTAGKSFKVWFLK